MKIVTCCLILLSIYLSGIHNVSAEEPSRSVHVMAAYQITDEDEAGFDFFIQRKLHNCGGKASNRYRSYSEHDAVAQRKFQLVMTALTHNYRLSIKHKECEDKAMLVEYIGVSK